MGTQTLLTKKEKALELGVSVVTLDRMRKKGLIHDIRVKDNKKQIYFLPENAINESIEFQPNN